MPEFEAFFYLVVEHNIYYTEVYTHRDWGSS